MRSLYTLVLGILCSIAVAQPVQDRTYTDCDGNTRTIYSILASGRPLIIASNGLDCSICMSNASSWESFASQNTQVVVWSAMTFTYSSDTPTCAQVSSWEATYGWSYVWSFIDSSRTWLKIGTPRYYVIDPADSTIAYEGGNTNQARQVALSLAGPLGAKEESLSKWAVWKDDQTIYLQSKNGNGTLHVRLLNITGHEVQGGDVRSVMGKASFELNDRYPQGVYLLLIENGKERSALKLIL